MIPPPVAGFLPSQACIGRGSPVCLKPTRHAPHAAMAAATLGLAASAALDPRPPWSGTIRQATDLCRRTLEGVPHTWRRALEACTKGCTTRDGLKRQAAGASWSLRRRGPLSSRPALQPAGGRVPDHPPVLPVPSAGAPFAALPPIAPSRSFCSAPPSAAFAMAGLVPPRGGLGGLSGWRT